MADSQLPEPRASDADREQAVETLRHAASDGQLTVEELEERISSAYAARTRNELERLTSDVRPVPQPRAGLTVREGPGGTRWVVPIMGGHDKRGRWRVAPRCTVLNIMGGSDVKRGRKLSREERKREKELRKARRRELEP